MNSDGYPLNSAFPDGITTDAIVSLDETANISLGDSTISLNAANVLVNGAPIGGGSGITNPLSADLDANEYSITNAGTVNAATFIKAGGTEQQYLMANGSSLQYSANSGNSNFYLYDSGTDQDPTPANGFITYNTVEQKQATEIYISHRTRDNIDIEVFFSNISSLNDVYLQDQSNSDNNIKYNITGSPTIVNQAQITIPVEWVSSSGTGSVSFGDGHNILLSFFTNSIETDIRITALEGKTQNINASPIGTDFTNNSSFILNPASSHTFVVRNNSFPSPTAKLAVSNTSVQINTPLFLQGNIISLVNDPIDVADVANKRYVDGLITPLQTKTQNISGSSLITTITRNTQFKLTGLDTFSVLDDSKLPNERFVVSNTIINVRVPMRMNTFALSGIPNPINLDDASNKSYVDQQTTGFIGSGLVPYYRQVNQILNITTAGQAETTITISPALFGSYSWVDTEIGQSRKWIVQGLQTRGTFSAVYTLRIKSGATVTDTFVIPAQGPAAVTNLPFILEILQIRTGVNSLRFYNKFETVNTGTTGFVAYSTTLNATAGVQSLNTSTAYTLTLQSSIASGALTVNYIEVTAMVK